MFFLIFSLNTPLAFYLITPSQTWYHSQKVLTLFNYMHICAILSSKIIYSCLMKQQLYLILRSLVISFGEFSSCNMNKTCFVQSYYTETQILDGGVTWSNPAKHKLIHNFKYTSNRTGTPIHI